METKWFQGVSDGVREHILLRSGAKWDIIPLVKRPRGTRWKEYMVEGLEKVVDLNSAYRHKVDAKGRMSLPASFRKVLAADLVVTINPKDECLYVFETAGFNAWVAKLFKDKFGEFDDTNDLHLKLRRKLKSRAVDVSVDASGRIMLSSDQRAAVGIEKDVVVLGNTGYFEIWDAKRYDQDDEEIDLGLLFG